MAVIIRDNQPLSSWIRRELTQAKTQKLGSPKGAPVRRIQEWLNLHGINISIDGDFGPVTDRAVRRFQGDNSLGVDGVVGPNTLRALTAPMTRTLTRIDPAGKTLAELTHAYARVHLAQHPVETGGENRGPWVRLYMNGNDGKEWLWCAGFVSFVMRQAAETLGQAMPIAGSISCDTLKAQAEAAGRFVSERAFGTGGADGNELDAGGIFLVRRTNNDWTHAGLVSRFDDELFETIEGNTNDEGNREGYEVCARIRGYRKKDFIRL